MKEPFINNSATSHVAMSATSSYGRLRGEEDPAGDLAELEDCSFLVPNAEKIAQNRRSFKSLVIAAALCFLFMIAEFVGGWLANSIAVYSDALHMLCDFLGFMLNVAGLCLSTRMPTNKWTFGYQRVETVAAMMSILLIWVMTGFLVWEATRRVVNPPGDVDGMVMILVGSVGIILNILIGGVLYMGGVGHSHFGQQCHGHSDGNSHGHDHNASPTTSSHHVGISEQPCLNETAPARHSHGHGHGSCHGHGHAQESKPASSHGHAHASEPASGPTDSHSGHAHGSISVHSAFVHAIGDLLQNVGVVVAGIMIKIDPHRFKIMDPVCTYIFSFLVLIITGPILKNGFLVLMETVPKHINSGVIKHDIRNIPNVRQLKDFHLWHLGYSDNALLISAEVDDELHGDSNASCHCALRSKCREQIKEVAARHGVNHCTVELSLHCERSGGSNSAPISTEKKPSHGHSHAHGHGHSHAAHSAPKARPPSVGEDKPESKD